MAELRALLIEWDPSTGIRAGGINNKEKALRCKGWQNMDVKPAIELRLVEDDRDLTVEPYVNTPGVTVLIGKDAINAAITINFPTRYEIIDREWMIEGARQKGVEAEEFHNMRGQEMAKKGFDLKLPGIVVKNPNLVD